MKFYHYTRLKVEELKTSKMLGKKDDGTNTQDTLSVLFKPVGKTNIDKLRSAGFKAWDGDMFLYEMDLKDIPFTKAMWSSIPWITSVEEMYDKIPKEQYLTLKAQMCGLPHECTKQQLRTWYNKHKDLLENMNNQVTLQIAAAKYHPDAKWRKFVKGTYACYIPHMLCILTKPVTKIKYLGKF